MSVVEALDWMRKRRSTQIGPTVIFLGDFATLPPRFGLYRNTCRSRSGSNFRIGISLQWKQPLFLRAY